MGSGQQGCVVCVQLCCDGGASCHGQQSCNCHRGILHSCNKHRVLSVGPAHVTVSAGVILAVMMQCASLAPQPTARRAWRVQVWCVAT